MMLIKKGLRNNKCVLFVDLFRSKKHNVHDKSKRAKEQCIYHIKGKLYTYKKIKRQINLSTYSHHSKFIIDNHTFKVNKHKQ